jgi:hypothetical protein
MRTDEAMKVETIAQLHDTACHEVARLTELRESDAKVIAALREALRLFVDHCTYPVSTEINPRGYAWRGEDSLDYARGQAVAALAGAYEQTAGKNG